MRRGHISTLARAHADTDPDLGAVTAQIEAGDAGGVVWAAETRDDICIGCPEVGTFAESDADDLSVHDTRLR